MTALGCTGATYSTHVEHRAAAYRASLVHSSPHTQPNDDTSGIGLLEVAWKLMEAIIDTKIHDCLNGFRSSRGTDTAIIEAKLIQQLAAIAGDALFECFVDLCHALDSVDHEEGLAILEDRGAGPNLLRLLHRFREQQ